MVMLVVKKHPNMSDKMSAYVNLDSYGIPKVRCSEVRILSEDDKELLLKQDSRILNPFIANKLEENAQKHWDQFYKRNTTKFFKDRHWTLLEFKELLPSDDSLVGKKILEVGCGVGNLLFPLIQACPSLKVYACDFSERAVKYVLSHELYDASRITAFQADITNSNLHKNFEGEMDIATMVFVLSAIHPSKFVLALKNVLGCLKTGGILLFRDYAVNDMTQLRFKPGNKISENFYMRQDGTRTYFFDIEKLREVADEAGLEEVECYYVHTRTINKKEGLDVPRVFLQAKFRKPK